MIGISGSLSPDSDCPGPERRIRCVSTNPSSYQTNEHHKKKEEDVQRRGICRFPALIYLWEFFTMKIIVIIHIFIGERKKSWQAMYLQSL